MKRLLIIAGMLLCCASCAKKPEPVSVQRMTELSELATVEYTVSKVIKATDDRNIMVLFGERKIIFNSTATLKAGFDLRGFTEKDVKCDLRQKKIALTLPSPKLLSMQMKAEDIRLVYEGSTGLRGKFTAEERNALQVQAEADIRAHVEEMGILDDARKFGTELFESFLKQCGYENVSIAFKAENKEGRK